MFAVSGVYFIVMGKPCSFKLWLLDFYDMILWENELDNIDLEESPQDISVERRKNRLFSMQWRLHVRLFDKVK